MTRAVMGCSGPEARMAGLSALVSGGAMPWGDA